MTMQFRRFLAFLLPLAFLRLGIVPDEGGGDFETPAASTTPPANTVDTAAAPDAVTTPPQATDKAGTMLEAMFGQERPAETAEAKAARLRDEQGRFARKADEVPGQKPAVPTDKPPVKTDLQMPEGLTPKAQERFQALANTNKQVTEKLAEFEPIVNSARELQATFQEHGVKREQFDQAMTVVGMMNRGNFEGALKALDEQRAMLAMALGRPVPGADPLANFPDLRGEVDNLQMTEARAIEIARARTVDGNRQQVQQRERQEQDAQQAQQAQVRDGKLAVDKVCKNLMATDLDYARIEPMLLEQIQGGLLDGIPPARWPHIVQKTYGLIKQTAGQVRSTSTTTAVLRPTGGESPRQAPKTMFEAMHGHPSA